jgi:RimJ/RimL family protein N-acetyltransferase
VAPTAEPTPRLEIVPGEQIFLGHVLREDIPTYARWFADLEVTTYLGAPGMSFTLENEQEWFDSLAKEQKKIFSIVVRESGQMIGNVAFNSIDMRKQVGELGITIGDKAAWGQGYGSEAVRLMCDYGFTFLSLHTIYLWLSAFNERGRHAYLKAGFNEAGRIRAAELFNGERYDRILMDITRADFGPSRLRGMIGQLTS